MLPNKRTGLSPRTYVVLPHDFGSHPDNSDLSLEAIGLYGLCLAWAGGEWTDGRLKTGAVKQMASRVGYSDVGWKPLLDELVKAGRVAPTGDDEYPYIITHWSKYQMTLAKYQEELSKKKRAGHLAQQSVENGPGGRFTSKRKPSGDRHSDGEADGQVTDAPSGDGESTVRCSSTPPSRSVEAKNIHSPSESGADGAEPVVDIKPSRTNYRQLPDESDADYRARLTRDFAGLPDTRANARDRNDIAYAWACKKLGAGRVQYGMVIGALRRAGSIDAYMRAVDTAEQRGIGLNDAMKYAMAVVKGNDPSRKLANISPLHQRVAAGISHAQADPDFEL